MGPKHRPFLKSNLDKSFDGPNPKPVLSRSYAVLDYLCIIACYCWSTLPWLIFCDLLQVMGFILRIVIVTFFPTVYFLALPIFQVCLLLHEILHDTSRPQVPSRAQRRRKRKPIPAYASNLCIFTTYQLHHVNGWNRSPILCNIAQRTADWTKRLTYLFVPIVRHLPSTPSDFLVFPVLIYTFAWLCVLPYVILTYPVKIVRFVLFIFYQGAKALLTIEPLWKVKTAFVAVTLDHDPLLQASW